MYFSNQYELDGDNIMRELNSKPQKIIFAIQCNIKSDANEFQIWAKERATNYVFNLKEEKTISYEWH